MDGQGGKSQNFSGEARTRDKDEGGSTLTPLVLQAPLAGLGGRGVVEVVEAVHEQGLVAANDLSEDRQHTIADTKYAVLI